MASPTLPAKLAEQLQRVPTSDDRGFRYAPCQVVLTSGEILPRVYVSEESVYLRHWGDDPGRPLLDVREVTSITESPAQLPALLANEVYAAGESGMGYREIAGLPLDVQDAWVPKPVRAESANDSLNLG